MPDATALIAEDEPLLAQALEADLQRLWPGLQVVARAADGVSALEQALAQQPQVCFLDIRMPGLDGLQVAEALAEDWPGPAPLPKVVFVTAYDQHAVQAFERQAVDYLLKPVEPARLQRCVARLQQLLGAAAGPAPVGAAVEPAPAEAPADPASHALEAALAPLRALLAGGLGAPPAARLEVVQALAGTTLHLVPVDEVLYFEAADKYVRVVTAERELLIRTPLRELLPQLDPQRWWQVHRGLVVQARAIATAVREPSGKVTLTLRNRPETLVGSRLHAHRFKPM